RLLLPPDADPPVRVRVLDVDRRSRLVRRADPGRDPCRGDRAARLPRGDAADAQSLALAARPRALRGLRPVARLAHRVDAVRVVGAPPARGLPLRRLRAPRNAPRERLFHRPRDERALVLDRRGAVRRAPSPPEVGLEPRVPRLARVRRGWDAARAPSLSP